ncbi:hypothetical protein [Actinomadura livida]|uniref:Uncharacterized protein n=1 Tax=Actinomadura livida TaxID=79909 RepID=A0A7W7N1S2_9ACTN|nr:MULTISPECIES: hypothetical protein [Actinomadura]MBB4778237.1 hypothetical protein [Actinomadura catellatispora]GGU29746.1 hypothetical protein GCM10010208_63270 [Actinomadura livida]
MPSLQLTPTRRRLRRWHPPPGHGPALAWQNPRWWKDGFRPAITYVFTALALFLTLVQQGVGWMGVCWWWWLVLVDEFPQRLVLLDRAGLDGDAVAVGVLQLEAVEPVIGDHSDQDQFVVFTHRPP